MARRRVARPTKGGVPESSAQPGNTQGDSRHPPFLAVGRILAPFGLRGEVKIEVLTDFPDRFRKLKQLFMGDPPAPVTLERVRRLHEQPILKFEGYDSRDAAEILRNLILWVPTSEAAPLGEDEYYVFQIEGLNVWTTQGEHLGAVTEVLFTGSNDVYVVRDANGREILLPALADVVREVDLDGERMIVELMDGLV